MSPAHPLGTFMPPLPALDRPPVRHGQTLGYETLQAEARDAITASGESQNAVGKRLGVSSAAISRALNEKPEGDNRPFASLLRRIIEELTDYTVADETTPTYRVLRKASA